MARKILCKLDEFHNTDVVVEGRQYHIGEDGFFNVDNDIHAAKLLKNKAKYDDADVIAANPPAPRKRPTPAQVAIVSEKGTGRILDPNETEELLTPVKEEGPKEDEVPPESAPSEWPEVSLRDTKDTLHDVLARLKKAGADVKIEPKHTKAEMLEEIERAYDNLK